MATAVQLLMLPVYGVVESRFSEWLTLLWAKISEAAAHCCDVDVR